MTTTITVKANHGWPVSVTTLDPRNQTKIATTEVAAGEVRDFSVHSSADLLIHEIQPEEAASAGDQDTTDEAASETEAAA